VSVAFVWRQAKDALADADAALMQQVMVARLDDGRTLAEIAGIVGVSVPNVSKRIARRLAEMEAGE
jgi:DNA-directed RNA polymerase specialized sigma subunit